MKLNYLAKTVVLGLAVLLAASAFASNKGSLQVQEAIEVGRRAGARVLMAITERTGGLMDDGKKKGK